MWAWTDCRPSGKTGVTHLYFDRPIDGAKRRARIFSVASKFSSLAVFCRYFGIRHVGVGVEHGQEGKTMSFLGQSAVDCCEAGASLEGSTQVQDPCFRIGPALVGI
jgi:hypothetical protein